MAAAVIGSLRIVLGLDSAQFTEGMTAARKHLRDVGRQMQSVGNTMAVAGAGMTAAITAPIIAAGFHLLKGSQDAAAAAAQVNASLASMGNGAGKTFEELSKTAESLRNLRGIDDDEILSKVTANLLTFGNVVGPTFDRAQEAILDISAKLKTDLQSATLMVGKALNNPTKGLTALTRAGLSFTDQQIAQIKAMQEVGDIAGAQAIMLAALETQVKGSAKAAGDADIWKPLKTTLMDLEGAFEPLVRDLFAPLIQKVADLTRAFAGISPQMQAFVLIGAGIAAALGPALIVIGSIVSAIGSLVAAFAAGGLLAGLGAFVVAAAPFVAAAAAIAAAVWAFRDDLLPIFDEFKKAVMAAVGPYLPGLMEAAKEAFAALGPAISAVVAVVGPILAGLAKVFVAVFGPIVITMLKALAAAVGSAFEVIGKALKVVTALLTGDWKGAWDAAGILVSTIALGIGRVIDAVFPGALNVITRMVDGVKRLFRVDLAKAFDDAKAKVREVGDAFYNLWDRVVGHSYIPDLVEDVGTWMARLQQTLVDPATTATKDAGDRFQALRDRVQGIIEGLLTDKERLDLAFAEDRSTLDEAAKSGRFDAATIAEFRRRADAKYAADNAGLDASGLQMPNTLPDITPIEDGAGYRSLNRAWTEIQDKIKQSRENFAEAFEYGIESALRGDWSGVLEAIVGDSFRNGLRNIGRSLFDSMGGGSSGGFSFGSIGNIFSKALDWLPGFQHGGSIMPGGAGGIDSQLVSFWKSPSEQVDVYTPGNDGGPMGGVTNVFQGNLMTPEFWAQIQNGDRHAALYGERNGAIGGARIVSANAARQQHQNRMHRG